MSKQGVKFVPFKPVTNEIGCQKAHDNIRGGVEIMYLTDDAWSSTRHTSDKAYMEKLIEALPSQFQGDYLLVKNARVIDSQDPRCTQISPQSHGLNEYMHCHNIAYLAATNFEPQLIKELKECYEFTDEDILNATVLSIAYQCVMRTSLRDPRVNHQRKILVGSRWLAEALQSLLPAASVRKLDGFEKPDKRTVDIPMTQADRCKKSRLVKAIKLGKPLTPIQCRIFNYLRSKYNSCKDLITLANEYLGY